jgi:hypothetical protein
MGWGYHSPLIPSPFLSAPIHDFHIYSSAMSDFVAKYPLQEVSHTSEREGVNDERPSFVVASGEGELGVDKQRAPVARPGMMATSMRKGISSIARLT